MLWKSAVQGMHSRSYEERHALSLSILQSTSGHFGQRETLERIDNDAIAIFELEI